MVRQPVSPTHGSVLVGANLEFVDALLYYFLIFFFLLLLRYYSLKNREVVAGPLPGHLNLQAGAAGCVLQPAFVPAVGDIGKQQFDRLPASRTCTVRPFSSKTRFGSSVMYTSAAIPILLDLKLPKQNWAGSGTPKSLKSDG